MHYFLGTVYKRQGSVEKAREHFLKSIVGRKKDWIVYLNLSQLDISQGNLPEAEKNTRLALDLEPSHTDIFNTLGAIEYAKRNWDDAKSWFEKSIDANRYNLEPRMNLALTYLNTKNISKAIEVYSDILTVAPDFKPAQAALVNLRR